MYPVLLIVLLLQQLFPFFSLSTVTAADCDTGANGDFSYFTLSPDFSISEKGVISPARGLDYERPGHLYEFVILAVDRGEPPNTGTATVRIRVSNVNDEAPEFSQAVSVLNIYYTRRIDIFCDIRT